MGNVLLSGSIGRRRRGLWAFPLILLSACGGGDAGSGTAAGTVQLAAATVAPAPSPTPTPASPTPTPAPSATTAAAARPVVLAEGDSISAFWSGSYTGLYAKANPGVDFYGKAVGGSGILGANSLDARFDTDAALKPRYVTILIGGNDLTSFASADAWLDALWAYAARWKATGARVAVGTVLPICLPQSAAQTAEHAARRKVANAAIRAAVGGRIDAVIDFAAEPAMGADAAACDLALYKDGLHPTDGTAGDGNGQAKLAAVYGAALNGLIERTAS